MRCLADEARGRAFRLDVYGSASVSEAAITPSVWMGWAHLGRGVCWVMGMLWNMLLFGIDDRRVSGGRRLRLWGDEDVRAGRAKLVQSVLEFEF